MFTSIKSSYATNKVTTAIVGTSVASGIIYSLAKKKSVWGVVGYTLAFALAGVAISVAVAQVTKKS